MSMCGIRQWEGSVKVVLFGGTGLLGAELLKRSRDIDAPSHNVVDVRDKQRVEQYLLDVRPDLVIHAAAVTDNRWVERHPGDAVWTNIIGTANVAMGSIAARARLVYISTDYVYRGDRGNYRETDEILPFNRYAWTKLGGEAAVQCVENHLIIRTSFGPSAFPYQQAFVDKWVSKDYVDVIAPMILDAALSPLTGIVNIGTDRKTVYEYARARNSAVKSVKAAHTAHNTPADTSLNLDRWYAFKNEKADCVTAAVCRICGSVQMEKYLDLGLMPLANDLAASAMEARAHPRYPLQVLFCHECGLSQLSAIVDREKMFSYYTYRSSISQTFTEHCRQMAKDLVARHLLQQGDLVVDIAGNDGTLLKEFKDIVGVRVLNVDPAANIAAISTARGIPVINTFWSAETAERILQEQGNPRIITATNVFAHVADTRAFLLAVRRCLSDQSTMIIECPYLVDFMEKREYDTVYFEHLSYFLVTPLKRLIEDADLKLLRVSRHSIHGGSIRLEIGKDHAVCDPSVAQCIAHEREAGYLDIQTYRQWAQVIDDLVKDISVNLIDLKRKGAQIAGFAASAKGNTLLNACRMSTDIIDYIVDDTPEKIGRFSPGTGIPIVNREILHKHPPDYLVILSWNFKDEIMRSLNAYHGKFVIPIPKFEILKK